MAHYDPSDNLISPIATQLAAILTQQIGVVRVYTEAPDGPPENNSAVIPPPSFKVLDDTNGKLRLKLSFAIKHLIRRAKMSESLTAAQHYYLPYLQAFSAWKNQGLYDGTKNLAREVTPISGGLVQMVEAGQVFIAFTCNVDVTVDLNIDTTT